MGFRADMRAAAVNLLEVYATTANIKLQVYPGRPMSIYPPCAFVDSISEGLTYPGVTRVQRVPNVSVVVLHGLFDSKEAATQADAFMDGFIAWVTTQYHAAGANTLIAVVATDDDPNYTADWMPPEKQRSYYATTITMEGFAGI